MTGQGMDSSPAHEALAADDASSIAQQKTLLRAKLLACREKEPASKRAAADARIKTNLEALPLFQAAQTVFCYVSTGAEVDTLSLLSALLASSKTVCVPRCEGKGIMHAHKLTALSELQAAALGIPAPPKEAPLLDPRDIDLIVVPCLASDLLGFRIGYGGAYYDRYLAALPSGARPTTVTLCRESLLLETTPREAHDMPVAVVVTDKRVVFCKPVQ